MFIIYFNARLNAFIIPKFRLQCSLVWLEAGSYFILSVKCFNETPPGGNG